MIKSFLKRVFSSSNEISASVETPHKEEIIEGSSATAEEVPQSPLHKMIKIERSWVEEHSIEPFDTIIRSCFEEMKQGATNIVRVRLALAEDMTQEMDDLFAKRLRSFLDFCEQEIIDLTFFLDKSDKDTMMLYKSYLLPEAVDELNMFLQDRCMMIYETAENLERNYRQEMENFFAALDLPINDRFFEDFESFKEQVLNSQEMEEEIQAQHQNASEQPVPSTTVIEVSREEVENENILQFDKFMDKALLTPEQALNYRGTLLFSFYGFGRHEDVLRMMNRKEIKDWAAILVEKHPYIFYFLNDVQYPMTKFLTSLVVTTEVEDGAVYYNEDELSDFRAYIEEALSKLAGWLGVEEENMLERFDENFQD